MSYGILVVDFSVCGFFIVKIGPYKKKRIVDVSKKIATELGFIDKGTARVKLDISPILKNMIGIFANCCL